MGDSSPPQLHAPAPGAAAPSSGAAATRIPRLHPPLRIETVQALPFRRNSNRTSHMDSADSSMDTPNARVFLTRLVKGERGDLSNEDRGKRIAAFRNPSAHLYVG